MIVFSIHNPLATGSRTYISGLDLSVKKTLILMRPSKKHGQDPPFKKKKTVPGSDDRQEKPGSGMDSRKTPRSNQIQIPAHGKKSCLQAITDISPQSSFPYEEILVKRNGAVRIVKEHIFAVIT